MVMLKSDMLRAVEKAMKETQSAYNKEAEASWNAKVATLSPMDKVPAKGKLYDQDAIDRYNAKRAECQSQANKAVDEYIGGIHQETVKVPSEEAVRAVQMFSLLNPATISKEDYAQRVDDLMNQYGDSAVTYETLRSMAVKAGIHDFKVHPSIEQRDAVSSIKHNVDSFFSNVVASSFKDEVDMSDARLSFTMWSLKTDAGKIKD